MDGERERHTQGDGDDFEMPAPKRAVANDEEDVEVEMSAPTRAVVSCRTSHRPPNSSCALPNSTIISLVTVCAFTVA